MYDVPGSLWSWIVMAQVIDIAVLHATSSSNHSSPQVKEGTENKGAIESVVRVVRKTVRSKFNQYLRKSMYALLQLLGVRPPLPIPPNAKQRVNNGWAMIDAGSFAVHVLSKQARERYFPPERYDRW
jgi:hypothetical protein